MKEVVILYISRISVNNYRQLKKVSINLEKHTSILAGPNNSGKTTLIQLLKRVLTEKNFNVQAYDFNIYDKKEWLNKVHNSIEQNKDRVVQSLVEGIEGNRLLLPEIEMRIQINYEETDDISKIAEYLMDLSLDRNSFYFIYKVSLSKKMICNLLEASKVKLESRALENESSFDANLINIYCSSLKDHVYFTDENYNNGTEIIDQSNFRELFNFECIPAARPVNDNSDKSHHLSNELIALVREDGEWIDKIDSLSDKVLSNLKDSNISETLQKGSSSALNGVLKLVSESNGGHTGELFFDSDVSQENVQGFIGNTTHAKYKVTGEDTNNEYFLNENSQGLGYSNLIFLHIKIQEFIKLRDSQKINLLVIEEPESHMHPQMQYVFAHELINVYNKTDLQGLITTHSTELVRGTDMSSLRVIREESRFNGKIYDLSKFVNEKVEKLADDHTPEITSVKNFKDFFAAIGIADLLFADMAILFEGDTERLYLRHIINHDDEFSPLRQKYIAYIQVGGAYAHKYMKILDFLKIKTLILTDIDYKECVREEIQLKESTTTNETIKNLYKENHVTEQSQEIKIKDIFTWITNVNHVIRKGNIKRLNGQIYQPELTFLEFQGNKDKYARTLEAAMLAKKFDLEPFAVLQREEWKEKRKETRLKFSISKSKEQSLIDILNATSGKKTDFMFSVILTGQAQNMLPNYIEEGLKWLMR